MVVNQASVFLYVYWMYWMLFPSSTWHVDDVISIGHFVQQSERKEKNVVTLKSSTNLRHITCEWEWALCEESWDKLCIQCWARRMLLQQRVIDSSFECKSWVSLSFLQNVISVSTWGHTPSLINTVCVCVCVHHSCAGWKEDSGEPGEEVGDCGTPGN